MQGIDLTPTFFLPLSPYQSHSEWIQQMRLKSQGSSLHFLAFTILIASIGWITEKQGNFEKTSSFLTTIKPLTVWITTNCEIFLKRWEWQSTLPASWETCMQNKKQKLELDREQWTGSKLGKECVKAVHCHPAYLTYMQITSYDMLGWMKLNLEPGLLGEISTISDMQMIPL